MATKKTVLLKDIAEASGYSINTVSRALREKSDISKATIQRIKKLADEMGYRTNFMASSLRRGYTNTIAVIIGDISNPHFSIMMSDIEKVLSKKDINAYILNSNENSENERKMINSALNNNVDGIIICPTDNSEDNLKYLEEVGIPFVQIGRFNENIHTEYVICDDRTGGYIATKYLIDNGHKDILLVIPSYKISSTKERFLGYQEALAEAGIGLKEDLICTVDIHNEIKSIEDSIEKVFQRNTHFTAIFAFSDIIALKTWNVLRKHGLRIPKDISIVGFDNIQKSLTFPQALSTIETNPNTSMGEEAVNILLKKIFEAKDEHTELKSIRLEARLVKGDTVKHL